MFAHLDGDGGARGPPETPIPLSYEPPDVAMLVVMMLTIVLASPPETTAYNPPTRIPSAPIQSTHSAISAPTSSVRRLFAACRCPATREAPAYELLIPVMPPTTVVTVFVSAPETTT